MASFPNKLLAGKTVAGLNLPWRVGADGELNGSTPGPPAILTGSKPMALAYGKTADGDNVPVLIDSDGNVVFA